MGSMASPRRAAPSGLSPLGGQRITRSDKRGGHIHILKCSPKYTRRTSALFTISEGVPSASTVPSLMM